MTDQENMIPTWHDREAEAMGVELTRVPGDHEDFPTAPFGVGYASMDGGGDTGDHDDRGPLTEDDGTIRTFASGATRDTATDKLDYEGFLSPDVLAIYAAYMHKCRFQSDGNLRDSDNWQRGIPREQYMKSAFRHFMEWWTSHRYGTYEPGTPVSPAAIDTLCAMMFNVMGYLFEVTQAR